MERRGAVGNPAEPCLERAHEDGERNDGRDGEEPGGRPASGPVESGRYRREDDEDERRPAGEGRVAVAAREVGQ